MSKTNTFKLTVIELYVYIDYDKTAAIKYKFAKITQIQYVILTIFQINSGLRDNVTYTFMH